MEWGRLNPGKTVEAELDTDVVPKIIYGPIDLPNKNVESYFNKIRVLKRFCEKGIIIW